MVGAELLADSATQRLLDLNGPALKRRPGPGPAMERADRARVVARAATVIPRPRRFVQSILLNISPPGRVRPGSRLADSRSRSNPRGGDWTVQMRAGWGWGGCGYTQGSMIGRLRGELVEVGGNQAVVDCGGVGYEVTVPEPVLLRLPLVGEPVDLLIRQIFREDGVTLYGFLEPFQRRLFDMLLTVQGCGPKVAMALLGQVGEDAVASAILSQDARALTRATGVGSKLGERIILELKTKIQEEALVRKIEAVQPVRRKPAPATDELVEALLALGYRRNEAETAAKEAREASPDLQEQLRHALRRLQK